MKPQIPKIIWNDWPALFCLMLIPGIWLIGAVFPFLRPSAKFDTVAMLGVPIPITIIAAAFLVWRVWRIHWFFANGVLVEGWVHDLIIVRDRGRLEFGYDWDGRTMRSWTPIHETKQVLALYPGQPAEILVDTQRPTKAIVRKLYV